MKKSVLVVFLLVLVSCSKPLSRDDRKLVDRYREMTVIDIHNHDSVWFVASDLFQVRSRFLWNRFGIDRIVLFGYISEPKAVKSDAKAFSVYTRQPGRFYPFFAGVNIHDEAGPAYVRECLEQGCFGMGEVVAASTYSPYTSKLPWKGEHPMDGYLPEIYRICGEYGAPVLLHIDPPFGPPFPVKQLEVALAAYPGTVFIFAHANAYNSPENLEPLLEKYDNLYIDFYAGFTAFNPDSNHTLEDYVPLIERYPGRFLVSSDSGAEITYQQAYIAIYRLLDLLSPETAERVAHRNFEELIDERSRQKGIPVEAGSFNKRQAGEWLAEN